MSRLVDGSRQNRFARALFSGLPGRYDLLVQLLSVGQNGRWRREMVGHALAGSPRRILDVACGTAGVALQLAARAGTAAEVVGLDLTPAMLQRGAENVAGTPQADRIHLLLGRAEELPFPDRTFDALTFTYLLRYVADPAATLKELARVVRPGGTITSLEFLVPPRRIWRALWLVYTRAALPVAGYLAGGEEWGKVGRFLGPSISEHYRRYPVPWTVQAWREAGIDDVGLRPMSLGGGLVMWGRRAP